MNTTSMVLQEQALEPAKYSRRSRSTSRQLPTIDKMTIETLINITLDSFNYIRGAEGARECVTGCARGGAW